MNEIIPALVLFIVLVLAQMLSRRPFVCKIIGHNRPNIWTYDWCADNIKVKCYRCGKFIAPHYYTSTGAGGVGDESYPF